jgi:hypothetical protein
MMRALSWSLAVAIVLTIVLLYLFLSRERDGESAEIAANPKESTEQLLRVEQAAAEPASREAAAGLRDKSSSQAPSTTVLVRVVDWQHFAPVEGAEVRWASYDWMSNAWGDAERDARLLASALVGTTDERGEFRVGLDDTLGFVQARSGELWAEGSAVAGNVCELVLAPDGELVVEVRDEGGTPLSGITVRARRSSRPSTSVDAETNAEGVARLGHARARLMAGATGGTLLVSIVSLDPTRTASLVSASPWPTEAIPLRMGATGEVLVRLVNALGEASVEPVQVLLGASIDGLPRAGSQLMSRAGEVLFRNVGLDAQLDVLAGSPDGRRGHESRKECPGPTRPGERIEVTLEIDEPPLLFSGRALREDGTPLRFEALDVSPRDAAHLPTTVGVLGRVRTDGEGRFRVFERHPEWMLTDAASMLVRAQTDGAECEVPLLSPAPSSGIELGDIRLLAVPSLVSGRVLSSDGGAIADAWISLQYKSSRPPRPLPDGVEVGGVPEWSTDTTRSVLSDARGHFELRTPPLYESTAFQVSADGHEPGPTLSFPSGTQGIEIVLQRGVVPLRGRVLLRTPDALARVFVSAAGLSGGKPDAFGRFTILRRTLAPIDVDVRVDGQGPEPFLTITQVTDPDDPRLAAIDLRPLLNEIRVHVAGRGGELLPEVKLMGQTPTGGGWQIFSDGDVTLLSRDLTVDFDVTASTFRPASFRAVRDGAILELEPAPALLLRVPQPLPAAGDGLTYVVDVSGEDKWNHRVVLRAGRTAQVPRVPLGKLDVRWSVARGESLLDDETLQRSTLEVETVDVECTLEVLPEAVAAALADVQARARKSVK